jgi:hypothetical protein
MNHSFFRKIVVSLVVAISAFTLSGCGKNDGVDGKVFHPVSGGPTATIEFKDGKAKVDIGGEVRTLDYTVDGDKVTIINKDQGDIVLNKHPDGSLTGAMGELVSSK